MGQLHRQVEGKVRGIAILNHPESFRHPTLACPHLRTFHKIHLVLVPLPRKKMVLLFSKKGSHLASRHRVIFHEGNTDEADISKAWVDYVSGT